MKKILILCVKKFLQPEEKPEIPEGIAKEITHSFLIFYDIKVK